MPPLNLEIRLPVHHHHERTGTNLSKKQGRNNTTNEDNDDCSVSSEISLDFIAKEFDNDRNGASSNSGWNPDDSDYSLNVLLPSTEGGDVVEFDESARSCLMGSDYSLNVALMKNQEKSTASEPCRSAPKRTKSTESLDPVVPRSIGADSPSVSAAARKSSSSGRRTVSFYPRVRIQRVLNRKDISEDQVEATWYSRSEFKEIRQECFDTISMMTGGEDLIDDDDESFCIRGLEYKTKDAYKERQRNKIEIRKLIFEEQQFQHENEMDDKEYIAGLSRDCSESCVLAAIEAAKKDEKDARAYLNSQ